MKEKLIEVKFKEDSDKAIIEIPKKILSKLHVNEENNYITLNYEYGEMILKRGIKDEEKLYKELHKLIDKYYECKKMNEEDTLKLFEYLKTLEFVEFNDSLKTKSIEAMDILTIETKEYIINITADYDVDLN